MEFKGVSSSSKPSAKSLKVSMGKRHYQTWDKGDFSFPITKLREDLVVALVDAGGNEIAHAGCWDEVFSMDGGGHVHLKLQFVLSEEERNRIRIMRESAMKKKLETNPNISLRLSETISSTRDSVETSTKNEQVVSDALKGFVEIMSPKVDASQAGSSSTSATSSVVSLSNYQKEGQSIFESAIPVKESSVNATDGIQGSPSSPGKLGVKIESPQVHERMPDKKIETEPLANMRPGIKEEAPSKLSGSDISDKNSSVVSKSPVDPIQNSRNQDPPKKTPSNVKKMISAFENSQLQNMVHLDSKQEVKSMKKSPSVPSQLNRFRKEVLFEDRQSKAVVLPADKTLTKAPSVPSQLNRLRKEGLIEDRESKPVVLPEDKSSTKSKDQYLQQTSTTVTQSGPSEAPKELASAVTTVLSGENDSNIADLSREASREPTVTENENLPVNLTRQSTSETATSSGRMPDEQLRITQDSKMLNSSESSVEEGSGRGTGLKSSTTIDVQMASNSKPRSLEYYSAQSSGMWIFPDNTRRLCITTAGKQVMKIVGPHHNEGETRQESKISSEAEVQEKNQMHTTEFKIGKNQKKIADKPESGCGSSPDDSSNGLFGQVIKIAVILGFGVLVLLTRQKEPRKKHREENDNLFRIPDYVDERTLKPWTQQQ
ncbi:hypothetical protein DH2020_039446 [Rehmannia glutinosa]|uniref:Uncharacterized protein n=1 Tax=Rehmannia glutinosa TaxID=99300 RepID=A0ABR0UWX9_REHGL